jgi:hypothetical protein
MKAYGLLAAALVLAVAASAAENLVANGSFNQHVAYWDLRNPDPGDEMDWDPEDAGGNPASGCMALTEDDGNDLIWSVQCIPALGGNEYVFGGSRKIVSSQGTTQILLQQYEDLVCSTGFISNFNTMSTVVGVWTSVNEPVTLDPAAHTVLLAGWFDNTSSGVGVAKFDEFFLYSDTVIFFDHFEYGDLLRWGWVVP